MLRVAVLLLIAATGSLWIAGTVAEAKGPPGKVTISGGNLVSELVISRPDLVPIDMTGYLPDTGGTPYARTTQIASETPYLVNIFLIEDSSNVPQLFVSDNYFPATSDHPSLFAEGGSLWKAEPHFAALLDGRIHSAASTVLFPANAPNTGGPPGNGTADAWTYALLVAGLLVLFGSSAAVAYSRRN